MSIETRKLKDNSILIDLYKSVLGKIRGYVKGEELNEAIKKIYKTSWIVDRYRDYDDYYYNVKEMTEVLLGCIPPDIRERMEKAENSLPPIGKDVY